MPIIYHVTTLTEWNNAKIIGYYEAPSLRTEGFIHCSKEEQVAGVLQRYFVGKNNMVKLVIETDKLTSKLIVEWSPTAKDNFPHIFGPINLDAIVDVETL